MYNNSKKKHNKRIIIVTIVLIVFSILTLITSRSSSKIELLFKDTIANIEYYFIKAPIQYVGNLFGEYHELKDVYDENKKLKEQLENLSREVAMNEVLAGELEDLKEITNIKHLPTDFQMKYAHVIGRDAESWQNEVIIDLGNMANIEKGMAVIDSKGMIGIVTQVSEMSSTVTLLSSENFKIQLPVMIQSGEQEYYGLLSSYDVKTQMYRVTLLSDVEKIEKDAKVLTSGLGGVDKSPKGILIGTVENYSTGSNTIEAVCMVKPSVNFDSINTVAVIQGMNKK